MVALYRFACYVETFYAVGIYCALRQPACVLYLPGFGFKDIDKSFAYNLAFLFGFGNSGQFAEELLARQRL